MGLAVLDPVDAVDQRGQRHGADGQQCAECESHAASLRRSVERETLKRRAAAAWLLPPMTAATAFAMGSGAWMPQRAMTGCTAQRWMMTGAGCGAWGRGETMAASASFNW